MGIEPHDVLNYKLVWHHFGAGATDNIAWYEQDGMFRVYDVDASREKFDTLLALLQLMTPIREYPTTKVYRLTRSELSQLVTMILGEWK